MSTKEMLRAVLIGSATYFLAPGLRGFIAAALLISAFLLTDWLAEDEIDKKVRAFSLRLASTVRRGGIR